MGAARGAQSQSGSKGGATSGSLSPFPKQDNAHRLEKDQDVQEQGVILDVIEIELELGPCIFDRGTVRVANLRPPGHARLHAVTQVVEGNLLLQLRNEVG